MNLLKDKKVAVIGGGPGGLTLARLLQQQGVQVKVYERDANPQFRQQGATLDLHYNSGLKALRAANLISEFKAHYRPGAERFTLTDNYAVTHYTERNEPPLEDIDNEYARPEIDRGPLRDLLIASLQKGTMVWDAKFAALEKKGAGWNIRFDNGTVAYADLVVGADGANSKIRQYITDIERIYSGITIVEGNIYNAAINAPKLWELTNGGKVYGLWKHKGIVLSAKGEGSLSVYTMTYEEEHWAKTSGFNFTDNDQVFAWFKERFSDWGKEWHEIFSSHTSYFIARPQYYFPAHQSWATLPNLTMIGDAAHQTPPVGEGVNQAMLDALELSQALGSNKHNDLWHALEVFEHAMLTRTATETTDAMTMVAGMQSENNLQFMLSFFQNLGK